MKYKIMLATVIVIALTSVTMYAVSQNQSKIEKMKEAIQLEEELINRKDSEIIAKIGTREVKENELEMVKLSYGLSGIKLTNDEALNKLIRNEVLFQTAIKSGLSVSDEELENHYNDVVSGLENSPETKEFFDELLNELDMNMDEYFEYSKETTMRDLVISKLKMTVLINYKENKNQTYEAYWNEYVEDLIRKTSNG
ncbi:MAG: hypothetical protein CVV00_12980 [Firmicutes bacterium HGW-Firmicutes-5]|nr:MAG: hypothetical protein CVV00_12980 [Firmicutes bacterium HGW-Firmicutes-5]